MQKRIFSAFLSLLIGVPMLSSCGRAEVSVFYDSSGAIITEEGYSAFCDVARKEAVEIISDILDCSEASAEKKLDFGGYGVKTTLNTAIYEQIEKASRKLSGCNSAVAVTNLKGGLLAVYSSSKDSNFALELNPPCSAIKPLSVYAPAVESGAVCWSSVQTDTAVKQITDSVGNVYDWPTNSNNRYTGESFNLFRAIKESCNTVAVKWLLELGVGESMSFLSGKLGVKLDRELQISALSGDEEILGNIALGYLLEGVSAVDMAGYYQIFANGGNYIKPYTVISIEDKSGKEIYSAEKTPSRIISEETAFIMNALLKAPLQNGGTAVKAKTEGVDIGGKTGTSTDNEDNWFVGFTPDYTCAVWHSSFSGQNTENISSELFAEIIGGLENSGSKYPVCDTVVQKAYCLESGLILSDKCCKMEIGYFSSESIPEKCNIH